MDKQTIDTLRALELKLHDEGDSVNSFALVQAIMVLEGKASPAHTEAAPVRLPDGSGFMVASLPLPSDHWLYAPRGEWDSDRDTYAEMPHPILTHEKRDAVVAAVRYAVRGATMCGKEPDFDPDAIVQNAVVALCGPYGFDASAPSPVSGADERAACIAPACHLWDGTDTCTCHQHSAMAVLGRVATALPVLRTMLQKEGLGGVDVADEMIADARAALASTTTGQQTASGGVALSGGVLLALHQMAQECSGSDFLERAKSLLGDLQPATTRFASTGQQALSTKDS